jgi:N utilization substance protein A
MAKKRSDKRPTIGDQIPAVRDTKTQNQGAAAAEDAGEPDGSAVDPRDTGLFEAVARPPGRGLGPEAGGQAGDTVGVSRDEIAGPESVEELLEEGQAYEAEVISGIENAPDADQGEVTTRQFPVDDVPQEYLDED